MRRTSNLRAITLSFFSPDLYRDVAQHWLGVGLVYLLLVVVLCSIPVLVSMQAGFALFARVEAGPLIAQIPPLIVHQGRVSTNVRMPYVIRGAHGAVFAIIDTTGQTTSLDDSPASALLTSTQFFMRKNVTETRVYGLSGIQHFEIDSEKVTKWLGLMVRWFAIVASPFVVATSFLFRLVQVLAGALVGLLIARVVGARLGFEALMRVSAVALTPVQVLDALRSVARFQVPMWPVLGVVIALVYLVAGIRASVPAAPASEAAPPPVA